MFDATPPFQWNFCPHCGLKLLSLSDGERDRPYCSTCDRFYYFNPVPATCCIVPKDGALLFVKRAVEPCRGQWTFPGGFLELGETTEEGALRELFEETGIVGKKIRLIGVSTQRSKTAGAVTILGYVIDEWDGQPRANSDALELRFFSEHERPPLAFQAHRELLTIYDLSLNK